MPVDTRGEGPKHSGLPTQKAVPPRLHYARKLAGRRVVRDVRHPSGHLSEVRPWVVRAEFLHGGAGLGSLPLRSSSLGPIGPKPSKRDSARPRKLLLRNDRVMFLRVQSSATPTEPAGSPYPSTPESDQATDHGWRRSRRSGRCGTACWTPVASTASCDPRLSAWPGGGGWFATPGKSRKKPSPWRRAGRSPRLCSSCTRAPTWPAPGGPGGHGPSPQTGCRDRFPLQVHPRVPWILLRCRTLTSPTTTRCGTVAPK
jgi:hypothetical protein